MLIQIHINEKLTKIFGWAWGEMCVASLITGLKNWLYLKSELMEWTDFLHGGVNSGKQKMDVVI